jgi:hypothetical protein
LSEEIVLTELEIYDTKIEELDLEAALRLDLDNDLGITVARNGGFAGVPKHSNFEPDFSCLKELESLRKLLRNVSGLTLLWEIESRRIIP